MTHEDASRELLAWIAAQHARAALASSLSAEDMVLTDMIARQRLPIDLFTLDTGRLHRDTLELLGEIRQRYGREVQVFFPEEKAINEYVARHGRNAFYGNAELRRRCCEIRKVEPLGRALAGRDAWITGQRRAQTAARADLAREEFDPVHGLKKFNPLADWTEGEVWHYIRERDVPCNRLYDQGYRSIGCAPCTRPVVAGEDPRAGRWWWEQASVRECGIHLEKTTP